MVALPLESVAVPTPTWAKVGGWAIKETSPVGVPDPEVTLTVKLCRFPWVILTVPVAGLVMTGVAVLKLVVTVLQFAIKFVTFTEPSPVARSYPAVVVHAGVFAANGAPGTTRMPNPPAVLL